MSSISFNSAINFVIDTTDTSYKPPEFNQTSKCSIEHSSFEALHQEHFKHFKTKAMPYYVALGEDVGKNSCLYDLSALALWLKSKRNFINLQSDKPFERIRIIGIDILGNTTPVATCDSNDSLQKSAAQYLPGYHSTQGAITGLRGALLRIDTVMEPARSLGVASFFVLQVFFPEQRVVQRCAALAEVLCERIINRGEESFGAKDVARIAISTGGCMLAASCIGAPILGATVTHLAIQGIKEIAIAWCRPTILRYVEVGPVEAEYDFT